MRCIVILWSYPCDKEKQKKGKKNYPWVLLCRNEYSLLEFEILGGKQVKICLFLWFFLGFTFLDPLNLCRQERKIIFESLFGIDTCSNMQLTKQHLQCHWKQGKFKVILQESAENQNNALYSYFQLDIQHLNNFPPYQRPFKTTRVFKQRSESPSRSSLSISLCYATKRIPA